MKNKRLTHFLLFLLLVINTIQQCEQTAQNDLLMSGNTFFYNTNAGPSKRDHIYQFPVTFSNPSSDIQIAASSSNFQIYSSSGLNFQIVAGKGSTNNYAVVALLIGEDSSWTNIRIHYLVSGRKDFFLGFFSAGISQNSLDIFLIQKYGAGNTVSAEYVLPNWLSTSGSYTAIAEISGIRTFSNSYSAKISSVNFNSINGGIVLSLTLGSSPIQSISITYIIFSTNAPFSYTSFDLLSSSTATYQFVGIQEINNGVSIYEGSAFISKAATSDKIKCIGSNCPSQCVTSQQCTASNGQISESNCYLCGNGQIFMNGNCQSFNICSNNQYFDGTKCLCFQGYALVGSDCYPSCGTNAYLKNFNCQCLPGYVYAPGTSFCVEQSTIACGANQILINNICSCQNGYGLVNQVCVICPINSSKSSDGRCVCNHGYSLNSATLTCVSDCYANAVRNNLGQCICSNGYYNTGSQCIPQTGCPNSQIWDGLACSCPQGQVIDSITNHCTYCNTNDRMVSNSKCVCSPTYYPTLIGCSSCASNSIYNQTTKNCTCMTGYVLQNGACIINSYCPPNSYWNQATNQCLCNAFLQYVINGYCQSCPLNSQWNGTLCLCQTGYTMKDNLCVCSPGTYLIGPTCRACDVNAVYILAQRTCVCKGGWYGTFDRCSQCPSSCATCSGPGNDQCITCPVNSQFSKGFCTSSSCPSGYYTDGNNNCQACLNNCAVCSNASSCIQCNPGYVSDSQIINGKTVSTCRIVSPTGSTLSLKGQVLGNGIVYQGVALSLMPTAILSGGCSFCDELLLVKATSIFTTPTSTVQYVVDSQYWFVISFSFPNAQFIPTFQYTIQLNPKYESYFKASEMNQILKGSYLVSSNNNLASGSSLKPSLTNTKFTAVFASDSKLVFDVSSSSSKGLITKLFS